MVGIVVLSAEAVAMEREVCLSSSVGCIELRVVFEIAGALGMAPTAVGR